MELKRKISSRKFWVCVCGFVSAMLAAFNLSGGASKITALIMAFGTLISYILAEGSVDAAGACAAQNAQNGVSGAEASAGPENGTEKIKIQ